MVNLKIGLSKNRLVMQMLYYSYRLVGQECKGDKSRLIFKGISFKECNTGPKLNIPLFLSLFSRSKLIAEAKDLTVDAAEEYWSLGFWFLLLGSSKRSTIVKRVMTS